MAFVAGRVAALVPVLGLVLAIVFSLVRAIPGDPAVVLLGPGATQEQVAALRDQLRLDLPAPLQFVEYVSALARGDLGTSLKTGEPVLREILLRLPATIELTLLATLVAILVGIPLGVACATRANGTLDHALRLVSLVGVSIPAFLLALVLQLVFARQIMGRPFMGPPGIPADRTAILRKGFMDALKDKELLAEADKAKLEITPVDGATIQKLVEDSYKVSPAVAKRAGELLK